MTQDQNPSLPLDFQGREKHVNRGKEKKPNSKIIDGSRDEEEKAGCKRGGPTTPRGKREGGKAGREHVAVRLNKWMG